MSLRDQLMNDLKTAMKEKNSDTVSALRMIMAAVKNEEIDRGSALEDADIQAAIARQVKQLNDAMKDFGAGGREDLVAQSAKEIALLNTYLPKQLSDDELEAITKAVMEKLGTSSKQDFGKIMGAVVAETKGKADGSRVKDAVNRLSV